MTPVLSIRAVERKGALTSTEATDEHLIASGSQAVFARLYDRHVDGVYRYCRLRLPDAADAEDATAMVFEKAFAAYPPDPSGTFRGWLFTIAHNVVADYYRSRRRRGPLQSIDDALHLADAGPTPEEFTLRNEEHRRLYRALERLPEAQRHVIELRLAGLTGAEIAETTRKSVNAVRQLQYRAMQQLRLLLSEPESKEGRDG